MPRIYAIGVEEEKCPNCLWPTSTAYVLAESEEQARELVKKGAWLCGECMASWLADKEFQIT